MKKISLTQNQFALVDDEDFEYLNQWKWYAKFHKDTNSFYAMRAETYYNELGVRKQRILKMHRVIMDTPIDMVVDHINHNTLDNQKANLRNCTNSDNMKNKISPHSNNRLGILGVQRHRNGFRAYISINGKNTVFKTRETIEEATLDRKRAELEYGYGMIHA